MHPSKNIKNPDSEQQKQHLYEHRKVDQNNLCVLRASVVLFFSKINHSKSQLISAGKEAIDQPGEGLLPAAATTPALEGGFVAIAPLKEGIPRIQRQEHAPEQHDQRHSQQAFGANPGDRRQPAIHDQVAHQSLLEPLPPKAIEGLPIPLFAPVHHPGTLGHLQFRGADAQVIGDLQQLFAGQFHLSHLFCLMGDRHLQNLVDIFLAVVGLGHLYPDIGCDLLGIRHGACIYCGRSRAAGVAQIGRLGWQ